LEEREYLSVLLLHIEWINPIFKIRFFINTMNPKSNEIRPLSSLRYIEEFAEYKLGEIVVKEKKYV